MKRDTTKYMADSTREAFWKQADEQLREHLPPGVKLLHTLRGHTAPIGRIAWSPSGDTLASPSDDRTVRLWEAKSGECIQKLGGHSGEVKNVTFHPAGKVLATTEVGGPVRFWDSSTAKLIRTIKGIKGNVEGIEFAPTGDTLALGMGNQVTILEAHTGQLLRVLTSSDRGTCESIAFDPSGKFLAAYIGGSVGFFDVTSGRQLYDLGVNAKEVCYSIEIDHSGANLATASGQTIKIWELNGGRLVRVLEGHTSIVDSISFSPIYPLLASKSNDSTVRLWRSDLWQEIAVIHQQKGPNSQWPSVAFHPYRPMLAVVGCDGDGATPGRDEVIHVYELDPTLLLKEIPTQVRNYINAKVMLVGDTGVGKTGLSLVLNNQQFEATDSTPGRRVWTLESGELLAGGGVRQARETLLWDLAGQPGYRIIHQLHLHETAVALVVFDSRSETDPLAGVRHWERALRLAQQRQGNTGVPMKKLLVSARNDRGGVSIGEDRLQSILKEFHFDAYFKTSAKEGWQIAELQQAIKEAIPWDALPVVSSSQLFADIKSFLLEVKKTGQLLAPVNQLYDAFARQHPDTAANVASLSEQLATCIGRLENRDLIRRLTFGGYVLLQPELLDAYASAMVNTAKEEPDGLGSLAEEVALSGKFFVPKEQKVGDLGQEQLLLHATVEELVRYDLG